MREKTASASVELASNPAANATDGKETVHGGTMRQGGAGRQYLRIKPGEQISASIGAYAAPQLMIINSSELSNGIILSFVGWNMRSISAIWAVAFVLFASAAFADSRVFIITNQSDGYGVDQCLARGETCGASAARSYCQSREFAQATAYRRVDPDEITGSVPKSGGNCPRGSCNEYIAITCQR